MGRKNLYTTIYHYYVLCIGCTGVLCCFNIIACNNKPSISTQYHESHCSSNFTCGKPQKLISQILLNISPGWWVNLFPFATRCKNNMPHRQKWSFNLYCGFSVRAKEKWNNPNTLVWYAVLGVNMWRLSGLGGRFIRRLVNITPFLTNTDLFQPF